MLKQLLWKQWKEQSWRIVFATVVLTSVTVMGLRARIAQDELVLILNFILGGFILPIFIAMGLIAPQRADGSFRSMLALPIPAWNTFMITATTGAIGCALPIFGACIAMLIVGHGREIPSDDVIRTYTAFAAVAVLLMYWTLCLSIRQRHEAGVAVVGIVVIALGAAAGFAGIVAIAGLEDQPRHPFWLFHPMGFGILLGSRDIPDAGLIMLRMAAVQSLLAAGLGWWAVQRMHETSTRTAAKRLGGGMFRILNRI